MIGRLLLVFVAALFLAAPRPAAAEASAAQIAAMKKVLALCEAHFGDNKTLRQQLRADGWVPEPGSPSYRYRKATEGLIAGHARRDSGPQACIVSARGLTMEQGRALILETTKRIGGFAPHPTEERTWVGMLKGVDVIMGITVPFDVQLFTAPSIGFLSGF